MVLHACSVDESCSKHGINFTGNNKMKLAVLSFALAIILIMTVMDTKADAVADADAEAIAEAGAAAGFVSIFCISMLINNTFLFLNFIIIANFLVYIV